MQKLKFKEMEETVEHHEQSLRSIFSSLRHLNVDDVRHQLDTLRRQGMSYALSSTVDKLALDFQTSLTEFKVQLKVFGDSVDKQVSRAEDRIIKTTLFLQETEEAIKEVKDTARRAEEKMVALSRSRAAQQMKEKLKTIGQSQGDEEPQRKDDREEPQGGVDQETIDRL